MLLTTFNISAQLSNKDSVIVNVSPEEFYFLLSTKEGNLIDVRTNEEYESSHLENALNIDYYRGDFQIRMDSLNKGLPLYLYCNSGNRSIISAQISETLGFKKIYNLQNGIIGWREANLELIEQKEKNDE